MNAIQQPSSVSAQKRKELLARLLAQQGYAATPRREAIGPRRRDEPPPLSFAQQRLWFLQQLEPGSGFYNIPAALRLWGNLDVAALRHSFAEIGRRHEVLRTHFEVIDNRPAQVVDPAPAPPVPLDDLTGWDESARDAEVRRQVAEEAERPFDLATGPLWRMRLLKLAADEHVLLLALHHSIADGWSIGVLIREFAALYPALRAGQPSPLPELPIQYADYADWQRRRLDDGALAESLNYWRKALAGAPTLSTLPPDRPRPAAQTYRGAAHRCVLPAALAADLHRLSRAEGATLFMILLAAFQVLLYRYSGQSDVCVGTPMANRNRTELEGLVGFFVNTLALRADLAGNPSFLALLAQVRGTVLAAQSHQEFPFEKLVEDLNPERNPSHGPLFQTAFVLQNAPVGKLEAPGLRIAPLEACDTAAKFDLTLEITEADGGLNARFEYNTDLFEAATMARLAANFHTLLAGIAARPAARLSELPLLAEPERRRLLEEWNAPPMEADLPEALHRWFERLAAIQPDAPAVVCGDERLDYGGLNRRANRLAHRLRERGVGPETPVGLCLERSVDLVVAMLAAMKAGGTYVPIDPEYPRERMAYLLADAAIAVLLTRESLLASLPPTTAEPLCLDRDAAWIDAAPAHDPAGAIAPDQIAYVIYTSGSTGRPKGVMVSHRNAVHSTAARLAYYEAPVQAFLLLSSVAFDSSVAGLFWTLSQGGTLCLPPEGAHKDPAALRALVHREKVSHLLALPSLYSLLLEQGPPAELASLQVAIVAGEACPPDLIGQHLSHLHGAALFNEYGPTENSVWSTAHRLDAAEAGQASVSIGRPIRNVRVYLLDTWLAPVPQGAPGELYLGGAGLGRGYLGQPGLTAERFIADPFGPPGGRLYKTGDLARWRADGCLEFLGRIDHQVKIRGYRIELGEIESVLARHPEVREAVALARRDRTGDARLVAYLVPRQREAAPEAVALRDFAARHLPGYMVPGAFVCLDALPLTANGKLDRKALPAPDGSSAARRGYVAPRTPLEARLANIWAELLGLDRVGVLDDFFEIGGHSLLATQLLIRLKQAFSPAPALGDLFKAPTVAGQARLLENPETPSATDPPVDLEAESLLDSADVPTTLAAPGHAEPKAILLTGATGFLGAFLIDELLRRTPAMVYCLVRADTDEAAAQRIYRNLDRYRINPAALADRIIPVRGDLAQPRLGLPEDEFQRLSAVIDAIYHNGALVHFAQPYAALKPANVDGTLEVLRLACSQKTKPLHYVSTVSIFGNHTHPEDSLGFSENHFPAPDENLAGGYAQTKWVAEQLVRAAGARGLPVAIYRPSQVTGSRRDGAWTSDDFLSRMILGSVLLGKAPAQGIPLNMVPVDYVSQAIVWLSRQPQSIGQTFHLTNAAPVFPQTLADWTRAAGYPMATVSFDAWREAAYASALSASQAHPLWPLLPFFESAAAAEDAAATPPQRFDCRATYAALADSGIPLPLIDQALWERYLAYYAGCGHIPKANRSDETHF